MAFTFLPDYYLVLPSSAAYSSLVSSSDGKNFYYIRGGTSVVQIPLSQDWNITSNGAEVVKDISTYASNAIGLSFSSTGHRMFFLNTGTNQIVQYNLGTNWDISTAVYAAIRYDSGLSGTRCALFFKSDGLYYYAVRRVANSRSIDRFTASSAWTLGTSTYDAAYGAGLEYVGTTDAWLNDSFTNSYFATPSTHIHRYACAAPSPANTTITEDIPISDVVGTKGVCLNADENRMFVLCEDSLHGGSHTIRYYIDSSNPPPGFIFWTNFQGQSEII